MDDAHETEAARLRALSQRVEELTQDIGSVLHANTSILIMAQQTLDVAIHALGPSPFTPGKAPTFEEADVALTEPAHRTAQAIERLLAAAAKPERAGLLAAADHEQLAAFVPLLTRHTELIPIVESRPSTLRTVARKIIEILAGLPARTMPREVVRELRRSAQEMERRVAQAACLQTRSAILQMDYTIRSFREFVTSDLRRRERPKPLAVSTLLDAAHRQLTEYAYSSNVEIRTKNEAPDVQVMGVERDLVRAIANVLHNAIKYSWHRGTYRAWVGVRVHRQGEIVRLAFENWGVPIGADELTSDAVFELGYRGQWSTDRGRLGTGIGLTDTRDIVLKHRGTIAIESRPARSWGAGKADDEEYYRQPFLTTVTIGFPEAP